MQDFKQIHIDGKPSNWFVNTDGVVKTKEGKLCKLYNNGNNYFWYGLWQKDKRKAKIRYIHRLIAEYFIKKPSAEHKEVNHIDGDKFNNSVENLEWVTAKENIRKAHEAGQMKPRAKVPWSFFTEAEVIEAYMSYHVFGDRLQVVANKMKRKRQSVHSIVYKQSRCSITDKIDENFVKFVDLVK